MSVSLVYRGNSQLKKVQYSPCLHSFCILTVKVGLIENLDMHRQHLYHSVLIRKYVNDIFKDKGRLCVLYLIKYIKYLTIQP